MREIVQMQKIQEIIRTYDTKQPLQVHLRNYFKAHKEMGSRDRKVYTQLAYSYYREKGMHPHDDAFFVAASVHDPILHAFHAYWSTQKQPLPSPQGAEYFPCWDKISDAVNKDALVNSIHRQPAVYIRCKKDRIKPVIDELTQAQFAFERDGVCIKFTNNYPLQELSTYQQGDFEIQDIASQQTRTLLHPQKNEAWWDCCAGSGGKSLLLLEEEKQIQLFVSDVRESILRNLQERFQRAGIRQYAAIIADLAQSDTSMLQSIPDMQGIIADVPCSGSGTWARTPERLDFFTPNDLQHYVSLQRQILEKAIPKLLPGGQFIYLTCSVFSDENEVQSAWISEQFGLQLAEQHYFQYSSEGGDTLFGARFIR